jgi:hypothetical protein
MEIFWRNKMVLPILIIPLTEIKIIFTHLINHVLFTNIKIINLAIRWQQNEIDETDTDRKKSCICCITESVSPT